MSATEFLNEPAKELDPTHAQGVTMPRNKTFDSIAQAIGDTPMIRINRLIPPGQATVFAKCEFFQPLNSVKDRIGVAMIEAGERDGKVNKDTVIVEPTSGNTGIALAFVCAAKGYKLILTMPESMSVERRALLRFMGAELVLTPAAEGMKGAIARASDLVEKTPNAWMPQQFDNPANPAIHEKTTGPEIWEDSGHNIDAIVAGVAPAERSRALRDTSNQRIRISKRSRSSRQTRP